MSTSSLRIVLGLGAAATLVFGAGACSSRDPHAGSPPAPAGAASVSAAPDAAPSTAAGDGAGSGTAGSLGCGTAGAVDLCDATLTLPAGACRTGTVTFSNGKAGALVLKKVVTVDVDHDGALDEVALLECQLGDPATEEVLAVSHGRTMSLVTGPAQGRALDLTADPTGAVRVRVDNLAGSDGWSYGRAVAQWRVYGWSGASFHQAGGPTSFTADTTATRLDLTVGPITVDPAAKDGKQRVWLTATVRNKGTVAAADLTVRSMLGFAVAAGACPAVTVAGASDIEVCTVGTLAAGASRTVTLAFTASAAEVATLHQTDEDFVQLRLGDQEYAFTKNLQSNALPGA